MSMTDKEWIDSVSKVLIKYGVAKEIKQENVAEELESSLHDYHDLAQQYSDMMTTYCYEDKPVKRSGAWTCPKCGKRTSFNHTHCHWCGKKLRWR